MRASRGSQSLNEVQRGSPEYIGGDMNPDKEEEEGTQQRQGKRERGILREGITKCPPAKKGHISGFAGPSILPKVAFAAEPHRRVRDECATFVKKNPLPSRGRARKCLSGRIRAVVDEVGMSFGKSVR